MHLHPSIQCAPLPTSPLQLARATSLSRKPLRKFAVFGRAAASEYASSSKPRDRSAARLEQLSSLTREILDTAVQSGPQGFQRSLQVANALVGVSREYAQSARSSKPLAPEVLLRKLFEKLGATYIKLGQFIASSPTLFPQQYVLEFQKCLDRTDPMPWPSIKKVIEHELKQPLNTVFSSVTPTPLASASVAQVHCATLRDSQKEVVLKVLKPGVEDVLTTDLSFLLVATKILEFINPQLARTSLVGIVSDIRSSMLDEVNFRKEAQHIQEFATYLDNAGMQQGATCPFVYKHLSSRRLLTMERLHGVPLTDLTSIRSMTQDPEQTLITALNTWFGSVLGCETFHADVHAGNLLVLTDGRVGFIDFGIVGKISPLTFQALQAFLVSTMSADYDMMARALITMGATQETVIIPDFARDLRALFADVDALNMGPLLRPGADIQAAAASMAADAGVNNLMLRIIDVGDKHGIRFPREFGMLLKQLLYFDRYTQLLAPTLSVLNDDRVNINQPAAIDTTGAS